MNRIGEQTATAPATATPDPRRWKALALLGTAFFMVILDGTIVLTALPSMKADLGFSTSTVQWVITAYAVAFGGLMLFGGRVADLLGRRRVFLTGLAVFVLASLVCGLAWAPGVLIAARAVQGVAAAFMAPTALAIVMTTFPEGAERNKALGVWGGLGGVGATAGLLIGGTVTSGIGWEWIFLINVPGGIVLLGLGPILLRESRDRRLDRRYDPAGAVTITAGLLLLVYGVFRAAEVGWGSTQTLGLLAGGAVLLVVFVLVETRSAAPLVPLRIFASRTLVAGNLVILAVGMAVDGMLFILTLYAQQVLGYSAVRFGLVTAVMTGMAIVGALVGQAMVTRVGLRPVAATGMVLLGVGCLMLTRVTADGGQLGRIIPGLLVLGPGLGAAFVASQIAALTGVVDEESGLASGLVDTAFRIGAALGVAIVSSVAVTRAAALGGGTESAAALTDGFESGFATAAGFTLIGLAAAVLLLRPGRRPS
jgi:EmrB/QacA subfamily drug resistance transporter